MSYCLGWLRTEENHYLTTPPSIARALPPESAALLGYAAHDAIDIGGGYLGSVELRDPLDLLAEGTPCERRSGSAARAPVGRRSARSARQALASKSARIDSIVTSVSTVPSSPMIP